MRFAKLSEPSDLADLLDLPYKSLCFYAYKKKNYSAFVVPKSAGGSRMIVQPVTPLKIIQRKLSQVLYAVYGSRGPVHGFARGRSIRSNAARHLGADWILNFDLKEFFPSIHFGRVAGMFAAKPYNLPKEVANLIAQICCHNGTLPIGAPSSPIIANMLCARLDSQLKTLAWSSGLVYTRYADDLTFSKRNGSFPKSVVVRDLKLKNWVLSEQVVQVIESNSFQVNPYKTRVRSKFSSQEITGIRINAGLNVNKMLYQQIRSLLRVWEKYGEEAAQKTFLKGLVASGKKNKQPKLRDSLRGKIEFLGFIKGRDHQVYVKLLQRLQEQIPTMKAKPITVQKTTHESVIRQAVWLLYDKDEDIQGTAFAVEGGCLLTAEHNLQDFMYASRPSFGAKKYLVQDLHRDADRDIASVKIDGPLPVVLKLGSGAQIALGAHICVAGFPHYHLGDSVAFRVGKVVQERKYFQQLHFVIDADIVKGNSGGPVMDMQNRVVGIAVKGLSIPGAMEDGDQLSSFVPIEKELFPHL